MGVLAEHVAACFTRYWHPDHDLEGSIYSSLGATLRYLHATNWIGSASDNVSTTRMPPATGALCTAQHCHRQTYRPSPALLGLSTVILCAAR